MFLPGHEALTKVYYDATQELKILQKIDFNLAHGERVAVLGASGSGKSTSISVVCNKYVADKHTAVIIWNTDKFEPYEVKDLIKISKIVIVLVVNKLKKFLILESYYERKFIFLFIFQFHKKIEIF